MDRRLAGLIFLGVALVIIGPFVHAQTADTAADAECPKGGTSGGVISGYYPDEPKNADFVDQGKTYHNLYGQPCSGPVVKASCRSADFCDATMSGSQCNDNGTWGACKETTPGKTTVAANGTSDAPSVSTDKPLTPAGQLASSPSAAPPSGSTGSGTGSTGTNGGNGGPSASSGSGTSVSQSSSGGSQISGSGTSGLQTPAGQLASSPSAAPPSSATGNPVEPIFTGGPGTSSIAPTQQNPFQTTPVSQSPTGPYSPTQSTFPTQGQVSNSGARSSLTNFVSSVNTFTSSSNALGSILNFFTGLLSIPASNETTQVVTSAPSNPQRIVVINNGSPVVNVPNEIPPLVQPQLSLDFFADPLSFTPVVENPSQDQSSYTQLQTIIGGTPTGIVQLSAEGIQTFSATSSGIQYAINPSGSLVQVAAASTTPIDLSSPAFDLVGDLNGAWTYSPQHLHDEASLAQAQSNYEWIVAQIQAMQAAQNAGVCGDSCESALSTLESELPDSQTQIQQLTQIVNEPPPAKFAQTYATPSQIVAQVIGFTPSPTIENVQGSAQYSANTPTLQDLASDTTVAPPIIVQIPQTPPNFMPLEPNYVAPQTFSAPEQPVAMTGLEQFVSNIWNTVQSWFEPVATSTTDRSQSCSLFASLFGKCKGW